MYAGILQHQKIIPKYEKLMVALFVCTRHIPPYTAIYRHMTVYVGICIWAYDGICGYIMFSGFQMSDTRYRGAKDPDAGPPGPDHAVIAAATAAAGPIRLD